MKKAATYSLDEETIAKLKEFADASHKSASQWITDKVWEEDNKRLLRNLCLKIKQYAASIGMTEQEFIEEFAKALNDTPMPAITNEGENT